MALIFLLRVHPVATRRSAAPENFALTPELRIDDYVDSFGNRCGRVNVPPGVAAVRFTNQALVRDSRPARRGQPEARCSTTRRDLPLETLQFLLPSRYCEVDSELLKFAWIAFGQTPPAGQRVQAICDFVHDHLRFDYQLARPTAPRSRPTASASASAATSPTSPSRSAAA